MSLGVLQSRQPQARRAGLSGEPPPAPWCWDHPGFKDCHGANWAKINAKQNELKHQHDTLRVPDAPPPMTQAQFDNAVYVLDNTKCDCPALDPHRGASSSSSASSSSAGLTYGNSSANDMTKQLQRDINAALTPNGMQPVGVDGKLGPGSCGAARYADQHYGTKISAKYGLASVCKAYTDPRPAAMVSAPSPVAPPTTLAPLEPAPTPGPSTGMLVAIGALAVGAFVIFKKKKG